MLEQQRDLLILLKQFARRFWSIPFKNLSFTCWLQPGFSSLSSTQVKLNPQQGYWVCRCIWHSYFHKPLWYVLVYDWYSGQIHGSLPIPWRWNQILFAGELYWSPFIKNPKHNLYRRIQVRWRYYYNLTSRSSGDFPQYLCRPGIVIPYALLAVAFTLWIIQSVTDLFITNKSILFLQETPSLLLLFFFLLHSISLSRLAIGILLCHVIWEFLNSQT